MNIKQFRYDDSNMGYLLWSDGEALAIDGGAASEILEFVEAKDLTLLYVTNTHEHSDHIPGNEELLRRTDAVNITPKAICRRKLLELGDEQLEAFSTPGHSDDSIVFYFNDDSGDNLITGDTLFNGTVGNCYTKNYELYFKSLQKVLTYPSKTRVFAGHDIFDYTTGVMEKIDPDNPYIEEYKALYSKELLVTTLEIELKVNPFIRFDDISLDSYRRELGMPLDTSFQRFRAMMTIH